MPSSDEARQGFVAFLDVLGFKNRVLRSDFGRLAQHYVNIILEAIEPKQIGFDLASDSAILYAYADPEPDPMRRHVGLDRISRFLDLVEAVGKITSRALVEIALPIRGGITFGPFSAQRFASGLQLIAGPAVVSAYQLEQMQDWVGVAISPAIFETFPKLWNDLFPGIKYFAAIDAIDAQGYFDPKTDGLRACKSLLGFDVPLRDGGYLQAFAVLPHKAEVLNHNADRLGILFDLTEYEHALDKAMWTASDQRSQDKYRAARRFVVRAIQSMYGLDIKPPAPD